MSGAQQQQLLFEVSLMGLLDPSSHARLLDVLAASASGQAEFEMEETVMRPAGWGADSGEAGWLRVKKLTEGDEAPRTFIVALQRPESARSQPQALVTPVLYTTVVSGGLGEDVARALGYQKTSSFTKKGTVFIYTVGLRVEVYKLSFPSSPPSDHFVVEVRSPPAPTSAVQQIIGHELDLKKKLVGLVALERMES